MRIKTNIVKLLAVLAILGSLVAIAAVPASAAAGYTLATISGPVGTSVTVQATGFIEGQVLTAKFDGSALSTSPSSITVPASGNINFTVIIPTTTAGVHRVLVLRDGQEVLPPGADFTVTPKVVITSPASKQGPVGTSVTVAGTGFSGAGVTADVTLTDNTTVPPTVKVLAAGAAVDSTGSFTATGTVPVFQAGDKAVSASDGAGKTATATDTFKVTPTLTITPTSGLPGSTVSLSGSGWPDGSIDVKFAGQTWYTINSTAGAITNGANKQIPVAASAGVKTVAGTSGAFTGSTNFTVVARALTLTPNSGPLGTQVLITGSNMTGGGTIAVGALTVAGDAWNTAVINIDSTGAISPTTIRVQGAHVVEGANTVLATDSGTLIALGSFSMTAPTITVTPTSGPKATAVTFTGSGWVPGATVTITFAGTNLTTVPDGSGNIAAAMNVPTAAVVGKNTINASDGYTNAAAVKFTVPAAAITVTPAEGAAGTSVTVAGTGFAPYTAIGIKIGGYQFLQQPLSDAFGAFSTTITVPGLAPGSTSVQVSDGNFISGNLVTAFFVIKTAPPTVASATAGISSQLVRIWGYSGGTWSMYDPADAAGSNLASLTSGAGYWINANAACTLIYGGYSYALSTGWNLIGWR